MGVPISQMAAVTRHVVINRLRRRSRYALVLMLEPLFRCNLACKGCGKVQHSAEILRRELTPEQCFAAAAECGAPIISIAGGEPLLHPQIDRIVAGLTARKKYVYLCTNGLTLESMLARFRPSHRLVLSVHLDGPQPVHDTIVGRPGVYDTATRAIAAAVKRGFRVATNTTLFADADAEQVRRHFDQLTQLGVEAIMVSPGFAYANASDQSAFLVRQQVEQLFRQVLQRPRHRWHLNQTPLFLLFLQGKYSLDCMPWGNPTYNVLGWQRPCYLLDESYCRSYHELLATTDWERYGTSGNHPACRQCMVHCGYEPSAVHATLSSWHGLWHTFRWYLGID